jgi:ABC-2 type transport system ATP-binding protein
MSILSLTNVSKRFGNFTAVDNISFELEPYTINGFLGPNGAGKTTTIKMICGILKPTSGSIILNSIDVVREPEKTRRSIGYMSQTFSLYSDLTVEENLRFFASLYNLSREEISKRISELLEMFGLREYRDTLTAELPSGIRQRVSLSSAILHSPSVLILDEPTSGVDPFFRIEFFKDIKEYISQYKATILLSTHFMNEAEYCDRILLFNRGRIILNGNPDNLIQDFSQKLSDIKTNKRASLEEIFIRLTEE